FIWDGAAYRFCAALVSTREPPFELGAGRGVERDGQQGHLAIVAAIADLTMAVEPGDGGAIAERHRDLARRPGAAEKFADRLQKLVDALSGQGRYGVLARAFGAGSGTGLQVIPAVGWQGVDLVQGFDQGCASPLLKRAKFL